MERAVVLFLVMVVLALCLFLYGLLLVLKGHRGTGLVASWSAVGLVLVSAWLTAYTVGPFLFVLVLGLGVTAVALSIRGSTGTSGPRRP